MGDRGKVEARSSPRPKVGVWESLLAAVPSGPVGWVFQGYPDERIGPSLGPGRLSHWDDARSRGKVADQPVLFLQADPNDPRWVAWGRVVEPSERWRVFGVDVLCSEVMVPGLAVIERAALPADGGGRSVDPRTHTWEYPELGRALGLERTRARTPFLDTGARDLRLGVHDLALLVALQPGLRRLGSYPLPGASGP